MQEAVGWRLAQVQDAASRPVHTYPICDQALRGEADSLVKRMQAI